jgi:hypothetical protein
MHRLMPGQQGDDCALLQPRNPPPGPAQHDCSTPVHRAAAGGNAGAAARSSSRLCLCLWCCSRPERERHAAAGARRERRGGAAVQQPSGWCADSGQEAAGGSSCSCSRTVCRCCSCSWGAQCTSRSWRPGRARAFKWPGCTWRTWQEAVYCYVEHTWS